ncbi:MAG TPA: cbb3-type cytochrome c oxidase subunit II [Cyclobacteriaceae bacterium]|nr:cbb3-type cytochrome c oxidase subunit II [Cyclobacteriaceae bacterium]
MVSLGKNHTLLALVSFSVFVLLSILIAVAPATTMQQSNAPLPGSSPLTDAEQRGLAIYVKEGCVACHTQQVRNIEMDNTWGTRPSIPADYYYAKQRPGIWRQTPTLLGSERTGPDLTSIGSRNPSDTWHMMHLYNPRVVVPESIMPSYPWLFSEKETAEENDMVLNLPPALNPRGKTIVASQDAKDLVAYLLSLKQVELPVIEQKFMPSRRSNNTATEGGTPAAGTADEVDAGLPDGAVLYQANCAVCHQPNGEGLPGAFPPLKESPIVNAEDPEIHIRTILQGYDARPEYATMQPFAGLLTDSEIAAIVNFERSHWGNQAPLVDEEKVKNVRSSLNP